MLDKSANKKRRVLGFDVRLLDEYAKRWPEERRNIYLIRSDAAPVLSTDVFVWPSLFTRADFISSTPQAVNKALFLWCDLDSLQQEINKFAGSVMHCVVAIELCYEDLNTTERREWDPFLWPTIPAQVEPSWVLLGYDVADMAFISGLTNCGYSQNEIKVLSEHYGTHLNRYHLFQNLRYASEFRMMTNIRVPEHAPFFVYGLYCIFNCSPLNSDPYPHFTWES
jgi:hypothetical protein